MSVVSQELAQMDPKHDFPSSPESRHPERKQACLKSAMCGRLRFGKSFLHGFAALVGAAMCSAF
jgi:hypothetical protein